jgi:mxaJ protein
MRQFPAIITAMLIGLLAASPSIQINRDRKSQANAAPVDGLKETPELAPMPRVRVLRISADPNNLPFTNERLEGFENRIAELLARELGAEIEYNWRAQRRGFFRHAFKENECDVVLAVPMGFDMALTTRPYYRSSYVFVSRKDRNLNIRSFDDPTLKKLKIGVQMVGDDGSNTPPAHALAARGIIDNIVGYTVYGDYSEDSPPARIIDAVINGDIDVAVVWGPHAGFHAKKPSTSLQLSPVQPEVDESGLPLTFSIAVGVRRGQKELRDEIDGILERKREAVEAILKEYGVPCLPPAKKKSQP